MELYDCLLSRYGNLNALNCDHELGSELMLKALENREKERQYLLYCNIYPWLNDPKPNFEKWCNVPKTGSSKKATKTKAEVIDLAERIRKADQAKRQVN